LSVGEDHLLGAAGDVGQLVDGVTGDAFERGPEDLPAYAAGLDQRVIDSA
jgi:hypothetical protein